MAQQSLPELADQIGGFIEYWGFKRIHGRIWTYLFVSQQPLDAAALIRQLEVSKALISISIKDLLEYDVIREVGKSSSGTQLYEANQNVTEVILGVLRQRERRMLGRIQTAFNEANDAASDLPVSEKRMEALGSMIQMAITALDSLMSLHAIDPKFLSKFDHIPKER